MKIWKEYNNSLINGKSKGYIKNIISLDIETSSLFHNSKGVFNFDYNKKGKYYNECDKYGICYIWMIGIDNEVYYGRELNELKEFIYQLNNEVDNKIVIYIHNLSFEFQFLRNIFEFDNVFARKEREVIKCKIKDSNIELRCSYALSNLSLDNLSKQYKLTNKCVGDLDYNLIRTSKTELSENELKYCENDCLIVNEYIKIMLNKYNSFDKIPLTSTGEIRKEFKKYISENYHNKNKFSLKDWKKEISKLSPTYEQFIDLVKCFSGGYVHSNPLYNNKVLKNITSIDYTSSYPYVMLSEKFPMKRFWIDKHTDLYKLDENKCYILTLKFTNIKSKGLMNYISFDKVEKGGKTKGYLLDNGRIDQAKTLEIKCTEQDWFIIKDNYDFDEVELLQSRSSIKEYLPKTFIEFIIKIYEDKSKLKLIKNKSVDNEVAYTKSKSLLNSLYGMCITNYIRDDIKYNEEWSTDEIDENNINDKLNDMRKNEKSLLSYSWGVWISAYARKNIWEGINKIGKDVVYVDTDSIKYLNNYDEFIEEYNKKTIKKIKDMCEYYNIEFPYYLKGIGEFENEGTYDEFKTLGAKKYIYSKNGKIHLTLSGVNKNSGKNAFNNVKDFKNGYTFNYKECNKNIKAYNDNQNEIEVIDYKGNKMKVYQKYGICLYPTTYTLDSSGEYKDYILKTYGKSKILNEL